MSVCQIGCHCKVCRRIKPPQIPIVSKATMRNCQYLQRRGLATFKAEEPCPPAFQIKRLTKLSTDLVARSERIARADTIKVQREADRLAKAEGEKMMLVLTGAPEMSHAPAVSTFEPEAQSPQS